MRFDEEYEGYRIRYRRFRGWVANIWPPLAYFPLSDVPCASDKEGKAVLILRAKSVIDAHRLAQDDCAWAGEAL